jgi:hypothetical protein
MIRERILTSTNFFISSFDFGCFEGRLTNKLGIAA